MTDNTALWLSSKRADFTLRPAPFPIVQSGEIVIRTRAIAVNPMDRLVQTSGDLMTPYLHYPAILGSDVAGDVVAVGADVTRFKVGDRVVGFAASTDKTRNRAAEGAFQTYVVLLEHMTAAIPDALAFEDASALPLGISTAACALFQRDFLALNPPAKGAMATGKTVLVWGGSTSVGVNAVQLAVGAGYAVIATASPRNFDMLRRLGATALFDYRSPSVIADIRAVLRGKTVAGAVAIGAGSVRPCIDILGTCEGNRFIAMATPPASFDAVPAGRDHWRKLLVAMAGTVTGNITLSLRARSKKVTLKMIWGSTLINNEVGPMIFDTFLPEALADGRYVAASAAEVVGHGLAAIPAALERQRRGVSATKLVVTL
ncbi:zinc-binding alcohol dehydrogenase family protein [Polymorphobacter megasporae]|uniref:zinc-binding alcohol dehydrogenase family protein n=1 Tax=Glacieibacterium megasporae TaxID=2835787 RepID=UPI001C1E2226|nr:zinc-binding alcohol dehydrogenase family protein [Polymorphobacter megasporae]UAJ12608.1 zinc-binding alcohol dehydrogenase family protein [Polymorphobacter megasporae]